MYIDLFKAIIQSMPIALIIIMLIFYKDIKKLLLDTSIQSISIGGIEFQFNNHEIKTTARFLIEAMNKRVEKEEWKTFGLIIASINKSNKSTVNEILNWKLDRDDNGIPKDDLTRVRLKILRALRGFGLIDPEDDGTWSDNSKVVVTEFGKYVSKDPKLKKLIEIKA